VAGMTERATRPNFGVPGDGGSDARSPDPGAVRVTLVGASPDDAAAKVVVGPGAETGHPTIDGHPDGASFRWLDGIRARLATSRGGDAASGDSLASVLLMPPGRASARSGVVRREVVVDGWRFEVEVEAAARAALRERASRAAASYVQTGPFEVRAVIPGRIVSVEVVPGDSVVAGQRVMTTSTVKSLLSEE